MVKKPLLKKIVAEIEEALGDTKSDLELARADLEKADNPDIAALINEEIDALLEEIALLEEELALSMASV